MGQMVEQFELPVCNKFIFKILQGKPCFELNVNDYKDQIDFETGMKDGLVFVMDYNEDKTTLENIDHVESGLTNNFLDVQPVKKQDALIYIETLGRMVEIN